MSLSINPVDTVKVLDPVVDLNAKREYAILKGGQENTYRVLPAVNQTDSTSTSFNVPPPSPNVIVDRKVYLRLVARVTLNSAGGAPVGQNLYQSGYDAPRAFPLSSVCETLQVTLNNSTVAMNMSDVISAITRFDDPVSAREGDFSTFPSQLDQGQRYNDLVNTVRNPLGSYWDAPDGAGMGRGGFPVTVVANGQNQAILDVTVTEPILLSPFYFADQRNAAGFVGLQNMTFTFNWAGDKSRFWSRADSFAGDDTTCTVTFSQHSLLFRYITPDPLVSPIPDTRNYAYFELSRYPTSYGAAIGAGAAARISSQNIQLQSIPRKLYVFARRRNADQTFKTTDTFLSIESVRVNWNNRNGLLSSASQQDLYHISRRNGVNMNWMQWSGGPYATSLGGAAVVYAGAVGSILALEMGVDIGLGFDEAAGIDGTYQLQIDVDVRNVNQTEAITPELYIVAVNEGIFTIENNRSIQEIGVISRKDVVEAASSAMQVDYNEIKLMAMYGGNILSSLKEGVSKVGKFIKEKAAPFVREKVLPIAKTIVPAQAERAEAVMDVLGLGAAGGVLLGGKKMSRAQLKKRLAGV